ncbi:hypothetical protein C2S51_035531, partial [Perilla frutescens var. frutescens]
VGAGKRVQDNYGMKTPSPNRKNLNCSKQGLAKMERPSPESESRSSSSAKKEQLDDQLGSTKAEMDEVMEENERLKMYLDRILKDYRTLQMQYRDVIQQEAIKSPPPPPRPHHDDHTETPHDHDLIDLSLGIGDTRKTPKIDNIEIGDDRKQGLSLGLDYKFELPEKSPVGPSPENSIEEVKEEGGETWPPKGIKNVRDGGDDESSQQNPAKRARVSVRVRCDTPTMNDGCQWRKYGQKIAKGNPCPRAYYRCTVAPSCPVQRCAEDMSILITTYEGTHNHPLPISATAMASTTSAAASMLMSGSSTSGTGPSTTTSTTTANLNGLNFYLSDNARSKPAFYLPNPSISSSPSFPTITLDLTSSSSSSSSSHLNRLGGFTPRYSTTNLNFSSLESNPLPVSNSYNNVNVVSNMLSYGPQTFNKNQNAAAAAAANNSLSFGSQPYETLYQSYLQKTITNPNNQQSLGPDTIAAATKAITSDPSFQSVLAAALTSIIGSSGGAATATLANQSAAEKSSAKAAGDPFPILSSFPSSSNANKCAPSFMNKSSSSSASSQPAGLTLLSPQFPFSNSNKSKSNSPGDHKRDHV